MTDQPLVLGADQCPLCGNANGCRLASGAPCKGLCWCERTVVPPELLTRIPQEARGRKCICASCVSGHQRACGYRPATGPADFYIDEAGRVVFTEDYHRRRGYCCGNGCRHCPFDSAGILREATV